MTANPKYREPMQAGKYKVVRVRAIRISVLDPDFHLVVHRITHPNGRARLTPTDFLAESAALAYAKRMGWRVKADR